MLGKTSHTASITDKTHKTNGMSNISLNHVTIYEYVYISDDIAKFYR